MSYENNLYCDFSASAASALAGKDVLLCVFDSTGTNLLAIAGQQGLTINRSAESIETSSKDTEGGWKSSIAGMKEWSIDTDGLYVASDEAHQALGAAFDAGDNVCVKVVNTKTETPMYGGVGCITDYTLEAPHDDGMTYSISIQGNGKLTDLNDEANATQMPDSTSAHVYTQSELNAMTKGEIASIAGDRGYTTVSEDDTKAEMITAFLAAQNA